MNKKDNFSKTEKDIANTYSRMMSNYSSVKSTLTLNALQNNFDQIMKKPKKGRNHQRLRNNMINSEQNIVENIMENEEAFSSGEEEIINLKGQMKVDPIMYQSVNQFVDGAPGTITHSTPMA